MFDNPLADQHRFDYFKPRYKEDVVYDELFLFFLNLEMLSSLVFSFHMIGHLVIES